MKIALQVPGGVDLVVDRTLIENYTYLINKRKIVHNIFIKTSQQGERRVVG